MLSKHFVDTIVAPTETRVSSGLSSQPSAGAYTLIINGVETPSISWDDTREDVGPLIRAIVGPNVRFFIENLPSDGPVLILHFYDFNVEVELGANSLSDGGPISFDDDPFVHNYVVRLDLGGFRDVYLEISYDAGSASTIYLYTGGTEDTMLYLPDFDQPLGTTAATLGLEIKNIFARYFSISEPGDTGLRGKFPVIRLQGLKLGA